MDYVTFCVRSAQRRSWFPTLFSYSIFFSRSFSLSIKFKVKMGRNSFPLFLLKCKCSFLSVFIADTHQTYSNKRHHWNIFKFISLFFGMLVSILLNATLFLHAFSWELIFYHRHKQLPVKYRGTTLAR